VDNISESLLFVGSSAGKEKGHLGKKDRKRGRTKNEQQGALFSFEALSLGSTDAREASSRIQGLCRGEGETSGGKERQD